MPPGNPRGQGPRGQGRGVRKPPAETSAAAIDEGAKTITKRLSRRQRRKARRKKRRQKLRDFFLGKPPIAAKQQHIGGKEEFLEEEVGSARDKAEEAAEKADEAREAELGAADSLSGLFDTGTDLIGQSAEQQQVGREGQTALRELIRSTPSLAQAQSDIAGERLREQQAVGQAGGADLGSILAGQVQSGEQFAGQTGAAVGAESIGREAQVAGLLGQGRRQDLGQQRLGQQIQLAGVQNQIAAQSKLLGAARAQKQIQDKFKFGLQQAQLRSDLAIQNARSKQKGKKGILGGILSAGGALVGGVFGGPGGAKVGAQVGSSIGSGVTQATDKPQTSATGAR